MYSIVTTEYMNDRRGTRSIWFFSYPAQNDTEAKKIIKTLKHDPAVQRIEQRLTLSGLVVESWCRDEEANAAEKLPENKSFSKLEQA